MKLIFPFRLFILPLVLTSVLLIQCESSTGKPGPSGSITSTLTKPIDENENSKARNTTFSTDSTYSRSFPDFLNELYTFYEPKIKARAEAFYQNICNEHQLDASDSTNFKKFHQLLLFHKMFTSDGAYDGAKGGMLKIPYLWHWVQPNPRHQIKDLSTNQLLKDRKPVSPFLKYSSRADIDRTPSLYWADLLTEQPSYYQTDCDTFYTFGWCSEREMAFVSLMELPPFSFQTAKVKASGNHSWSEFLVTMKDSKGRDQWFNVHVDNTFNAIEWNPVPQPNRERWINDVGKGKLPLWYNKKAHSVSEKDKIANLKVSATVALRISEKVRLYFDE